MMLAAAWIDSPWEALVAVVLILAVAYVVHGRPVKAAVGRVAVEVGQVREAVESIDQKASAIDHAVNQRAAGETTVSTDVAEIRERVARIEDRLASGDGQFARIEDRLGVIEDAVTSP